MQRLRCASCSFYFTAKRDPQPGETAGMNADCAAYLAINRTQGGMPYHRSEGIFKAMGVPLSKQRIYDACKAAADIFEPIYEAMKDEIAQCPHLANDSTSQKILSVTAIKQDPDYKKGTKKDPSERSSSRSSVVMGFDEGGELQGVIFETSQKHSGEVIGEILERRSGYLPKPVVMADMASSSDSADFKKNGDSYIRAGCNDHALRKLVEASESYPQLVPCIKLYKQVYAIDALAKDYDLDPEQRLKLHQEKSTVLMFQIKQEAERIMAGTHQKIRAEPNSSEGQALKYFLNHCDALTQFLKLLGTQLSNACSERAIKRPILNRNNSRVHLTLTGAKVIDILNTLGYSASHIGLNENTYFTDILENQHLIKKEAKNWTPRAYLKAQLARASPICLAS